MPTYPPTPVEKLNCVPPCSLATSTHAAPPAHRQCNQVEVFSCALLDAPVCNKANLAGAGDGEVILNRRHGDLQGRMRAQTSFGDGNRE